MAVKYRVSFGTFHGHQGNYRLDISNTDYSGGIEETITNEEVIRIEYTKDYDDYSPIVSSMADVVLVETEGISYDRFQEDGNQTWKVEMLYEDPDNAGNYLVHWVGWIVSESYEEQVQSFPNYISFTATDGLGELSRLTIDAATSEDEQPLLEYVRLGLRKTGLGLNILYNTGLEASFQQGTDYIESTTVHPYSFYEDELTTRVTELDRIETILGGMTCRIAQSGGRWMITSWSDYEGVVSADSTEENIVFNAIDSEGNDLPDVTENVRYEIKRSSGSNVDLISTSDMANEWRDPFWSTTQRVSNYTLASINSNPLFDLGSEGYTFRQGSVQSAVSRSGSRAAILEGQGDDDTNSVDTRWFNSVGIEPPAFGSGYRVRFSFRTDWTSTNVFSAEMRYRILIEYDNNTGGLSILGRNADYHVWNFERNLWHAEDVGARGDGGFDAEYIGRAEATTSGEWNDVEIDVRGAFGLGTNPRLFIELHEPVALAGDNVRTSTDTLLTTYVDSVRILPLVSFVPAHFELNQTTSRNYTKQYETETFITTRGEDIFYNLLSNTTVNRVKNPTERLSLEEIVLQQRLNDYRDGGSFYRGGFINNTGHPLAMHHKPFVTYSGRTELVGGIIDEISFSARNNISDVLFRIPNQVDDVASEFNEFNVEPTVLIPETSPFRTLTLDITSTGLGDNGLPLTYTSGSETLNVIKNSSNEEGVIEFAGLPGTMFKEKIILETDPADTENDYEITVSDWYRTGSLADPDVADENDADYMPLPDYIEIGDFIQQGRNIEIPLNITIPHRNDTVELGFEGEANPFTADNRSFDLTFALANSVDNAVISGTMRALRGPQGGVSFAQVIISPSAGHQLTATSFTVVGTLPTGVQLIGFSQLGTGVVAEFAITYQATDQTATITLNGDDGVAVAGGVTTSIVTLAISEDIANVSVPLTSIPITGVVGTTAQYSLPLYAADGYELNSGNFSATESSSALTMFDAVGGGDSVQIPFNITFPAEAESVTVTIDGSAQEIGAETTTYTVNITNNVTNSTLTETTETFIGQPGQAMRYTNTMTANSGYNLVESQLALTGTGWSTSPAGTDAVNLHKLITFGATNVTDALTVAGTLPIEPHRFFIDLNTTGLVSASVNQPSTISHPFDMSDYGSTETITVQVTGVDGRAFTMSDTITLSHGSNISTSTPTFAGGIWTFDITLLYPSTAPDIIEDIFETLTITGTAPQTSQTDALYTATLNFTDTIANADAAVPSVTLQGAEGETVTYDLMIIPAGGYRITAANVTTTDDSEQVTVGADDTRGLQVRVPITVTFASSDITANITVAGTAIRIGNAVETYGLTVSASGMNFTIPDWTSTQTIEKPVGIDHEGVIFIQSDVGYRATGVSNVSAPTGVSVGTATVQGDGIALPFTVTGTGTGTLTFDVATAAEPYLLVVDLDESVNEATLSHKVLSTRFGPTDFGNTVNLGTVSMRPTQGLFQFTNTNQITLPTVSGLTFGTPSLANGIISFTVSATYPSIPGDVSYSATIAAGTPTEQPASRSEQSPRTLTVPANGGTFGFSMTANGVWEFPGPLGGNEDIADQFFTIRNVNNEGSRGGTWTIDVPANTTGATRTFSRIVTDGGTNSIGGVTITQTADNNVQSSGVTSISVDIGGTAGSETGVLYIT